MKLQDITNMDKDDVLGMLGLEARRSQSNRMLTTLGTFGIGLLVGAGVALLLAPKAGSDLRQNLRAKFRRDGKGEADRANGSDGATAGSPTSAPVIGSQHAMRQSERMKHASRRWPARICCLLCRPSAACGDGDGNGAGGGGAGRAAVRESRGGRRLRDPREDRHLDGADLRRHRKPRRQPGGRHLHHGILADRGRHQRVLDVAAGDRQGLRRRLHGAHALQPDHGRRRHAARVHRRGGARARRHRARRRKHRRHDARPGRLQMGHRPSHPDGRHAQRPRDGRLDLPDRPGPHHGERREGRPRRRGAAQERLLAGRRSRRSRHDRARRGRRPDADVGHAADRRVDQRQAAGADGGQHRRQHRVVEPPR